ncbi:Rpa49 subunit specific to nuclear RNA polymerase I [Coprinopsis cinerea okayama7|uniref:Rpa49 subunit specific to nuclear RNA polymerase I n=1 Tax=Coprinopsis cinerea (strain Okayama-7 / 130 / ATCC MYA-4618 / FGSC 9003) TaxID=240176 RepID=A8NJ81_COPC7|nr:Rpa49 subunit specific to nuclear RNA polymerase I [Coprinopsis cinerea okayama7\|eukprot:XP_001834166.1 Rpa49 subunit specific to nuclear RNA polymerase I [Coprinopsis cinerea okayama7\
MSTNKSSSKKRKRDASPSSTLTFELSSSKQTKGGPFLVNYPVVKAPEKTAFNCYANKKQKTSGDAEDERQNDILLAGETETVEFMTNEDETYRVAQGGCHYFIALHNKKTGKVAVLPQSTSPHILVHTVKALKSIAPAPAPSKTQFREAKNALGETFGTKKAKAAIRAQERNHVDVGAMEGVMGYVMDSIDKGAEGLMTTEEAKVASDTNRLIPPFSTEATSPDDIYPLYSIIPEAEWKALSISALDSTKNEKERLALLPYRYSEWLRQHLRNSGTAESPKTRKRNLKILLYISAMLAFRQATSRKEINKDQIYEKLAPLPSIVADSLLSRFTEVARGSTSYQSTSTTKTNLLTHIFALCLKVDQFATDTEMLAQDLSMKTAEVNQLFRSLGCKMVKLGDRERTRLGLSDESAEKKRAVLTAPVEFPKPRLRRKT